jgi:uncharacterized membrane protein YqiK
LNMDLKDLSPLLIAYQVIIALILISLIYLIFKYLIKKNKDIS